MVTANIVKNKQLQAKRIISLLLAVKVKLKKSTSLPPVK
jgi:hypothetical protein